MAFLVGDELFLSLRMLHSHEQNHLFLEWIIDHALDWALGYKVSMEASFHKKINNFIYFLTQTYHKRLSYNSNFWENNLNI